jgi:G:T-mismatch repair DNA endonuclease (very short patch repair protein)
MTTDERLAELQRKLAWAQLVGWNCMGAEQRKARERVEAIKRQIALIEQNRGTGGGESNR